MTKIFRWSASSCFIRTSASQSIGVSVPCSVAERLFAVNDEERIARHRVERLDPTVEEHRETAEFLHLESAPPVVPEERRNDVEKRRGHDQPGDVRARLHRFCFLTKPNKCIENWATSPSATSPQAM